MFVQLLLTCDFNLTPKRLMGSKEKVDRIYLFYGLVWGQRKIGKVVCHLVFWFDEVGLAWRTLQVETARPRLRDELMAANRFIT